MTPDFSDHELDAWIEENSVPMERAEDIDEDTRSAARALFRTSSDVHFHLMVIKALASRPLNKEAVVQLGCGPLENLVHRISGPAVTALIEAMDELPLLRSAMRYVWLDKVDPRVFALQQRIIAVEGPPD
jgi:hypothetical protein